MAKKVWYVGHNPAGVTLSNDYWKQRVGEDKPATAFTQAGGFSIDASTLTSRQLRWFESQADFYVVDTELAARAPDAVPVLASSPSGGGGGGVTEPVTGDGVLPTEVVTAALLENVDVTTSQSTSMTPHTVTETITPVVTG